MKLRVDSHIEFTSYHALKALNHCMIRSLIGWKGRDRLSSFHIGRWRPTGPKKLSWMKSLHKFLHGILYIMFHDMLEFASCTFPRGRPNANFSKPCQWMSCGWEMRALTITWSWPLSMCEVTLVVMGPHLQSILLINNYIMTILAFYNNDIWWIQRHSFRKAHMIPR